MRSTVRPKAKPLILIGGGGHAKSVISALLRSGRKVKGILDKEELVGQKVLGVPVIATDEILNTIEPGTHEFIVTVGSVKDNSARAKLRKRVQSLGHGLSVCVSDSAIIGEDTVLGAGTVVLERAIVNAGARVGANCIINTGAIVEHDVTLSDDVHIAPGAVIGGGVSIGERAFIGAGAVVLQSVKIGADAVVGAGAVVIRDIPARATAVGSPAKATIKRDERRSK